MRRTECDNGNKGNAIIRAILIAVVVGTASAWAAPSPARTGTLRLLTQSVFNGDQVTVGDVAMLEGFADPSHADALSKQALFAGPEPGSHEVVTASQIREALYAQGVNLSEVVLTGSARVQIVRLVEEDLPGKSVPTDSDADQSSAPAGTLEALLRADIEARFAEYGGWIDVQFSRTHDANRALSLNGSQYEFRITPVEPHKLGLVSHAVEVLRDGQRLETLHILSNVALVRNVVIAERPINRGRAIERDDVRLAERRFQRLDQIGESNPARIVGQQARRFIEKGDLVGVRDVKAMPLVHRNELVTVWNRGGAVAIKTVGKALESGGLGDLIEIKSERSGEKYVVRVTGVRSAEVANAAGDERVAVR